MIMDNVRLRRLKADYEALRRLARLHPLIEIEGAAGNPPERYRLILRVQSLRQRGDELEPADEHRLEITLPLGYPRDAPLFRMLTPVFHPNIAPHAVCIGDHWSAAESLDALIQRVGELLAFQSYNTKSPLNGAAAKWVDQHRDRLPIDRRELVVDLTAADERSAALACANCAAAVSTSAGVRCAAPPQHPLCDDCAMTCAACARVICLVCAEPACTACQRAARETAPARPDAYGLPSSAGST
jgi:Ubiquitin-conjugating enzyme